MQPDDRGEHQSAPSEEFGIVYVGSHAFLVVSFYEHMPPVAAANRCLFVFAPSPEGCWNQRPRQTLLPVSLPQILINAPRIFCRRARRPRKSPGTVVTACAQRRMLRNCNR